MTAEGTALSAPPSLNRSGAVPGARIALTLLLLINLFNYIDRYVLAAVEPKIEAAFMDPADPWVEAKMGALAVAFTISYMLFAPLFGYFADRMSRWWLIGIGVTVWSLASGASGLALGYWMLLATRIVVGVGEGAYGPAAPALLSDMYPVERRGYIMAWFYAAIPVGSALGYVLGGKMLSVSEHFTGTADWRWAFYVVVPPGLLLALWSFFMRETPRGHSDAVRANQSGSRVSVGSELQRRENSVDVATHQATWADYRVILSTPSFVYTTLGYTALTFVQGGVAYWMPRYVHLNRGEPDLAHANYIFGLIVVVSGLLSTLLGGLAGDWLRGKLPGAYLLVSGWGALLAFPLMVAVLFVEFPYAWALIFLAVFWMFFNTGPVNTVMANVTHPSVRASAFALNILVIHLFGDAISPYLMGFLAGIGRIVSNDGQKEGWLAEALGRHGGMDFSFAVTSLLLLVAGVLWLRGARHVEQDTALAPHRLAPRPPSPADGVAAESGGK